MNLLNQIIRLPHPFQATIKLPNLSNQPSPTNIQKTNLNINLINPSKLLYLLDQPFSKRYLLLGDVFLRSFE